jgi:deazaflavin-dependent oxidoreductase (nitroreductase family)
MGQPILLLSTRGAKSGQPRTTPLLYTPYEGGFIVVASNSALAGGGKGYVASR